MILKKGTAPSVDLEPEYIAANDKTAYVTLQEANAIAIVDLQTLSIEISVPQDMKITKNIRSILIKRCGIQAGILSVASRNPYAGRNFSV